jgi:Pvc16 N-terminal domain
MIDRVLSLLSDELQNYITFSNASADVIIDNIGMLETSNSDSLNRHIVITLVNVEEESALKNISPIKKGVSGLAKYENPPVFLNLYVLITCNYSGSDYILALRRLSAVIRFFQSRNSFSTRNSTNTTTPLADSADLKFTMELYTLTFEQINHLWGSLGGRQVPFVMYKLRVVAITERAVVRTVPLIEEIETNLNKIQKN